MEDLDYSLRGIVILGYADQKKNTILKLISQCTQRIYLISKLLL